MISAIIAGGGSGSRLKNLPKAFLKIGGRELIYYSLDSFYGKADETVLVLPAQDIGPWGEKIKKRYGNLEIVAGGKHRQDSVRNAVGVLANKLGVVFIHDVARPFLNKSLLDRLLSGAEKYGACVPFLPVRDTIKETEGCFVKTTLKRENIVQIQTPQAFRADILRKAYKKAYEERFYGSDDAVLVERLGVKVCLVEGEQHNIKITYPFDVELAKTILKKWKTAE